MKSLIKIAVVLTATSLLGACASNYQTYSVDALVLNVEQAREACAYPKDNNGGSVIAGGVVGGFAGNQFGGGKGRIAMTVLGTVLGMTVADNSTRTKADKNKMVCKSDGYDVTVTYMHPVHNEKIIETHNMAKPPKQRYLRFPISVLKPGAN